jgi:hypothetical protein
LNTNDGCCGVDDIGNDAMEDLRQNLGHRNDDVRDNEAILDASLEEERLENSLAD